MKKFIKLVVLLLAAVLVFNLSACSGERSTNATSKAEEKGIIYGSAPESGTLDPAGISSTYYWYYSAFTLAPLVELAEDGSYDCITAESYDVNEDMTEYVFHIREDAKWNDGSDCTSKDFLNTIQRSLDPNCGSGYSDMLFVIKNAEEIYNGTADISTLGVECSDDKTLKFMLKEPCPYFTDLMSLPVFMPSNVKYATETNGEWCHNPETSLANGPFYLAEYVPEQYCLLKKNPNYVQADRISLDYVKIVCIADTQSMINAYKTGEIDIAPADYTVLGEYDGKPDLKVVPSITSYYTLLNWNVKPLDDVKVREALCIGINRDEVCASAGSDTESSTFFVAKYLTSKVSGKNWVEEIDPLFTEDIQRAQQLLAEAGYPGGAGFPELIFKYPSQQIDADMAQAIQAQWKKNLGINIKLEAQEYQVNISDRRAKDFDICRMRWTADFADPNTYLTMYTSDSTYNDSNIICPEFDDLMAQANVNTNPEERFALLHEAEKVLIGKNFAFIPILNKQNITLVNPKIGNFVIDPSRNSYRYKYATLSE